MAIVKSLFALLIAGALAPPSLSCLDGSCQNERTHQDAMYRTLEKPNWKSVRTTFVPYYAWSNRGTSEMTVWMPIVWK